MEKLHLRTQNLCLIHVWDLFIVFLFTVTAQAVSEQLAEYPESV